MTNQRPQTQSHVPTAPTAEAPSRSRTPIYETTTFVFESAAAGASDYNEGNSDEVPLLALRQSDRAARSSSDRGARRRGGGDAALERSGGDDDRAAGAAAGGRRGRVQRRDLRRHAAPARGSPRPVRHPARFASLEELPQPDVADRRRTRLVWFESPINPTLRCVDIAAVAAACRARGVLSVIDNTFASPSTSSRSRSASIWSCTAPTKYLNGHSDVTAGVLAGPRALMDASRRRAGCSARSSIRMPPTRSAAG